MQNLAQTNRCLGCQWQKKHKPDEWAKRNVDCNTCQDRFLCMTVVAQRFNVEVTNSVTKYYEMFAEVIEDLKFNETNLISVAENLKPIKTIRETETYTRTKNARKSGKKS